MIEASALQRRDWRASKPTRYAFGAGFVVAAAMTAISVWLAVSAPGTGSIGPPSLAILTVLWCNLILILGLAAVVAWRVFRLFSRRVSAGAKLHLRFVLLFAIAAGAPAVVVALFFGALVNQGIDSWFSRRIESVVDNSAAVARAYVEDKQDTIGSRVADTAEDLNRNAAKLTSEPVGYSQYLEAQASMRNFSAIFVIDRKGRILSKTNGPNDPSFIPPQEKYFQDTDRDIVVIVEPEGPDVIRALYRLRSYPDAYIYAYQPMAAGITRYLFGADSNRSLYRDARDNRARVQAVFALSYAETALLVLIGSVWLGMAVASSISVPVGRLVEAADKIAGGDLSARVEAGNAPEDIGVLSNAFNRMTSDLRAQQDALRAASLEAESRRQFIETVLSGVSAGVLSLDEQGRVSACNRQAVKLLALGEADAQNRPLAEAAPELAAVVLRAGEGGEAETELDIVRGGDTRRLRVRASSLPDGGLVLTFDDITRLVAAQRNAAWRDVARRIAHEIKNPLTPIQLSAERLRKKYRKEIASDPETFDRCTDTIIRQVGDIGRMVDEFSAFARMPAPRFGRHDAAEMLREAVFARRVADPEITVELVEPIEAAEFVCDERMVGQALLNILKNAAEAIATRRVHGAPFEGRIRASLHADEETVSFEVVDNGVGLPAKDRDRLTEPYVTTREKGTGLGLAIVRRIVEDHGGALVLQDAPELPGARVTLSFPKGQDARATIPMAAEA